MKKPLTVLLFVISPLIISSCIENEGPVGPTGPQGPPGPVGQGFEIQASFSEANNYSGVFAFPNNAEVLSTDIVMVYLLWDVDQGTGNDVWQALPASVFFNDGELQYGFDHTLADVQLFLTGDTDLSTVGPEYTQEQIFRVAILPVDYLENRKVDLSNMQEVMGAIGSENIQHLEISPN